jgi:pimeloyl-ACP methyl ester carboxylesterase
MKQKPTLVITPGLGDDLAIYETFARRWRWLGYDVHVVPFGWADRGARLRSKLDTFLMQLDALPGDDLYLIGVSAGGTAVVNAMARRPDRVKKVVTVCAPLDTMLDLRNPLLAESIEQTRQLLLHYNPDQKSRILSVFALYDPVVSTKLSRPPGVRTMRVLMIAHPLAIFVALNVVCSSNQHIFKEVITAERGGA